MVKCWYVISSEFNIRWPFPTEHLPPGLAWHLTPHVMTPYSIYIRKKKVYSARSIGEEVWITWTDIECSSFTLPHQVQACTGHLPNVQSFVCTTHFVSKWFSRCMFDKLWSFLWTSCDTYKMSRVEKTPFFLLVMIHRLPWLILQI